jgi:hypothetical protein
LGRADVEERNGQALGALGKVNEALIEGLKTAIFVLKKQERLTPERRKSMIESLKAMVAQSQEIYGEAPMKH